eukprot:14566450-Alexandrium_andersonii.AAC.1
MRLAPGTHNGPILNPEETRRWLKIDAPGTTVWSLRASGARSETGKQRLEAPQAKPGSSTPPRGRAFHTGMPHRRSEAPALGSF